MRLIAFRHHHHDEHGHECREVGRAPHTRSSRTAPGSRAASRRGSTGCCRSTPDGGWRRRRRARSSSRRPGTSLARRSPSGRSCQRTSRGTASAVGDRDGDDEPTNMAAPPGDGTVCTLRAGIAMAPMREATHRMANVRMNVTARRPHRRGDTRPSQELRRATGRAGTWRTARSPRAARRRRHRDRRPCAAPAR